MSSKKTKLLGYSFLNYRVDYIWKRMQKFRGPIPPSERETISLLVGCHEMGKALFDSPDCDGLRAGLIKSLVEFAEYTITALKWIYKPSPTHRVATTLVRKGLLSNPDVRLPSGKIISDIGATDGEIAWAIEKQCTEEGRPMKITPKMVQSERNRLEMNYGDHAAHLVEVCLKLNAEIELLYPKEQRAKIRNEMRDSILAGFYQPQKPPRIPSGSMPSKSV